MPFGCCFNKPTQLPRPSLIEETLRILQETRVSHCPQPKNQLCTPQSTDCMQEPRRGQKTGKHTQRSEEPPVLPAGVSLLKHLLNRLLGVLPLRDLLEGVGRDDTLKALKLERVARGHEVVVVDHLDEGLDLVALFLALLRHPAGDLGGVSLDAGDDGVAELVGLLAVVDGLKDHDLEGEEHSSAILLFL